MKFSCWLDPKQLLRLLIPNNWAIKDRGETGTNWEHRSCCQLPLSRACTRGSAHVRLINNRSVRHLQCWAGVNQAGLGTGTLPWAPRGDGKGFSAAGKRMLIYLLAASSSLCPPFPASQRRLTETKASFWRLSGWLLWPKKVSVTMFCSSRINEAVLSLLVTKQSAASSLVFLRSLQ